jgi:hypothetical protein
MKQLKVSLPDDLRALLDRASKKSGESVAEEIRRRVEQSFAQEAVDKPTRDFLEGVALMPAEIELECGAPWHRHAGSFEVFVQAIVSRLDGLKPKGPIAFGDRPHATVFNDAPHQLGALIEFRLRRQPDFSNSPTRRLMEEEHQRSRAEHRKSGTKIITRVDERMRGRPFQEVLDEQAKLDQQRKKGKKP